MTSDVLGVRRSAEQVVLTGPAIIFALACSRYLCAALLVESFRSSARDSFFLIGCALPCLPFGCNLIEPSAEE